MKKIMLGIVAILAILVIIFLLRSAPIDPAAYNPPKSQELAGVLAPNNLLHKAELLALGKINGPEEVAVDSHGCVYGGTQNGKIIRLLTDGKLDTFAETNGRPLGIQFDKNKNLIVCDAFKVYSPLIPKGRLRFWPLQRMVFPSSSPMPWTFPAMGPSILRMRAPSMGKMNISMTF